MSATPEFIEFAAIQIFAAMVDKDNPGRVGIANAGHAWDLAKMLYDAKPRETGEETNEDDDEDDQPCMWFDFVIDDNGTYGVYRDGVFVLEARSEHMDNVSSEYLRNALKIPVEMCIMSSYLHINGTIAEGGWPKLYEDAKKIGNAGPF